MSDQSPDEKYAGSSERERFDLAAEVANADGDETCHVCNSPATYLVELTQDTSGVNTVELGSAVFLCERCFSLTLAKDAATLRTHFTDATNLPREDLGPADELTGVARRIVEGQVASAPLRH